MKNKAERLKIQNSLLELQQQVKEELMKLPNVVNVGIGLKETAGKLTDDIVFQIFVKEKVEEGTLQSEQVIPKEIKGFKTDVIILPKAKKRTDGSEHRPIKGGIQIGNGKGHVGTLGCFARLVADDTLVLLSNHHVLFSDGASAGEKIGQPDIESRCCCCCAYISGENGIILNPSFDNESVDCAIATVNAEIATDIILNNSMTSTSLRILGTEPGVVGDTVRKIGCTSGLTTGTINSITGSAADKTGQIFVRPIDAETYREKTNGKKAFSDLGDSGSVIINEDNYIIGLLWGGDSATFPVDETYACHIAAVLEAFRSGGAEVEIETTPAGRTAQALRNPLFPKRLDLTLREKLIETERGALLVSLFETHQKETLQLINNNRKVTIVWHRYQGPAFTAHIAKSYENADYIIPQQINGISLQELLIKTSSVLKENGSFVLKQAIENHALGIIQDSYGIMTVHNFVEKMSYETEEVLSDFLA
ncbi:MAG: hypothetical protein M3R36_03980 [Bacteroidota bacterium]|nr:hypothetical protein [Bacteroidota bacterium]